MRLLKNIIAGVMVGGWTVSIFGGPLMARENSEDAVPGVSSARGDWQRKVLRNGQARHPGAQPATAASHRTTQGASQRSGAVRTAAASVRAPQQEVNLLDEPMGLDPMPPDSGYGSFDVGVQAAGGFGVGGHGVVGHVGPDAPFPGSSDCLDCGGGQGEFHDGCHGGCGEGCGEGCAGGGAYFDEWATGGVGFCPVPARSWMQDLSLFAGVHGFKGPADQGLNGNFGLQEGVNFGSPIGGPFPIGFQVGMTAVQSNFSGDQADQSLATGNQLDVRRGDRDQIFLTTGLFHRAPNGGWQGGVAFDLLNDAYYDRADLTQFRTEIGYVFAGGCREVGYLGAYGSATDTFRLADQSFLHLDPTDMHALYYRRYFNEGGEGRFFAGLSGQGDALLGADLRVPVGHSWALENRAGYLIPKQARGAPGQSEESWGLTIQVVWYPGRSARCVNRSPFRPLFGVADNATFMVDTSNH